MGFLNVGLSIAPVALPVAPVAAGVSLAKQMPRQPYAVYDGAAFWRKCQRSMGEFLRAKQ